VQRNIDELVKERDWVFDQLSSIKELRVWPSDANFILVRSLTKVGSEIFRQLKNKGFLVKDLSGSHDSLANCLRITIGNHQENIEFISDLKDLCR